MRDGRCNDDPHEPLVLILCEEIHFVVGSLQLVRDKDKAHHRMAQSAPPPPPLPRYQTTRAKFDAHKERFAEHGLAFVELDSEEEVGRFTGGTIEMVFVIREGEGEKYAVVYSSVPKGGSVSESESPSPLSLLQVVENELQTGNFAQIDRLIHQVLSQLDSLPCDANKIMVLDGKIQNEISPATSPESSPSSSAACACFATSFGPILSIALTKNCPSFRALQRVMVTFESSPWLVLTSIGQLFLVGELLAMSLSEMTDSIHEDHTLRQVAWNLQTGVERTGWVSVCVLEDYGRVISVSAKGSNIPDATRDVVDGFASKLAHHNHTLFVSLKEQQQHATTTVEQPVGSGPRSGKGDESDEEQQEEEDSWTMSRSERRDVAKKSMAVFDKLLGRARSVGL